MKYYEKRGSRIELYKNADVEDFRIKIIDYGFSVPFKQGEEIKFPMTQKLGDAKINPPEVSFDDDYNLKLESYDQGKF